MGWYPEMEESRSDEVDKVNDGDVRATQHIGEDHSRQVWGRGVLIMIIWFY